MSSDAASAKRALRAEIRARRQRATTADRERDAEGLTARLVDLVTRSGAESVAAYLSTAHEPSTRGFLAWAHDAGLTVLLPVSREDGLLDWARYEDGPEAVDHLGMPTPASELLGPIAVDEVDLIIIPASAVDPSGMRMGWGRGYYDRTLGSMAARPPVYAVVFDHELLAEVPHDAHDERVDGVVTPTRILTFDEAMPTYSYRCTECATAFDIVQAFTDDALTECPSCHGRLRKVFSAIGVTFSGSGFYRTDSRAEAKAGAGAAAKAGTGDGGSAASASSGSTSSSAGSATPGSAG